MKAKVDAFFKIATQEDISALLKRTNYDFYRNVRPPESWQEEDAGVVTTARVCVHATVAANVGVASPVVFVSREFLATDHIDLALAA